MRIFIYFYVIFMVVGIITCFIQDGLQQERNIKKYKLKKLAEEYDAYLIAEFEELENS